MFHYRLTPDYCVVRNSPSSRRRSQRGGAEAPSPLPSANEKNIKASLVNLTLNIRYKMTKKYQICHHQIRFFSSSICTKICFRPGLCPDTAYTLPIPLPARRFWRLRRLRHLGSQAPLNTKSWLRQWQYHPYCASGQSDSRVPTQRGC